MRRKQRNSDHLMERFGEELPLDEPPYGPPTCSNCCGASNADTAVCEECGMMETELPLSDIQASKRVPDPKDPRTTRDAFGRPNGRWTGETVPREKGDKRSPKTVNEVTPPGREKQVRALKKQKGIDNPWAVAWSSYDKSHKR